MTKTLKNTAQIISSGKKLNFESRIELKALLVDIEIVLQVFENLMSNAVRYAECEINVLLETKNDRLVITVSDDGCGFNAKDIKIATDPFYTTEKNPRASISVLG